MIPAVAYFRMSTDRQETSIADQRTEVTKLAKERGFKILREYQDEGLMILGFPCDQFGHQEPGSEDEILEFCTTRFGVSFPLHAKIEVNGEGKHPLYAELEAAAPGLLGSRSIKWNFTKFLVSRTGEVLERFGSVTKPEKLAARIREALAAK